MTNMVKKYPHMSFLLIGFIFGCVVAGVGVYATTQSADIYKEQVTKLERELIISDYRYEELNKEHKELKTSFNETYEEITKADGSRIVRRITNKETDETVDRSSSSSTILHESSETTAASTAVTTRETKDLNLSLSLDTDLDVHFGIGYRVLPPFSIEFGMEINPSNPSNIKGIRFGVGVRL